MHPETLYGKLVASHTVSRLDEDNVLLYADLHILNEYTSPQAFAGLHARGIRVAAPGQSVAVVDHVIPTHPVEHRTIQDSASALQAATVKRNCDEFGIPLFDTNDPLQGIEHVIAPELGLIRPGMVVLCGDSHTTTYGALGALGFGIGTSEVEHVLATQTLVYRLAKDMRIRVDGTLSFGCTSKDLILHIINRIGAQGARGYVVEFCGDAIDGMSTEARMTLCNMAVEAGARGALIAPDETTFHYVRDRAIDMHTHMANAIESWKRLKSEANACFDAELEFDAGGVAPRATWGTSPEQSIPIDGVIPYPTDADNPIARSSYERVRAMVVPGSGAVRKQAEQEGLAAILIDAGFEWRQPGCSMCLAMNDDVLKPGERCASTTNRNFEGRQGRGGRTHLMSPAMAAAAALSGFITDVRKMDPHVV